MNCHGVTRNSDGCLGQLIVSLSAAQHIRETKSKYFHFQEHLVLQFLRGNSALRNHLIA